MSTDPGGIPDSFGAEALAPARISAALHSYYIVATNGHFHAVLAMAGLGVLHRRPCGKWMGGNWQFQALSSRKSQSIGSLADSV